MRSNPPPGADTMPRLIPLHPTHPIDPRLARCAWQWLVLGLLLSATLPEARGYSTAIGWLWYWLIAAPTLALCMVYRQRLWLALRQGWRRRATARVSARSEEHTSELQSLMRISYAVFCLEKKTRQQEEN